MRYARPDFATRYAPDHGEVNRDYPSRMTTNRLRRAALLAALVSLLPGLSPAQQAPAPPAERGAAFLTVTFAAVMPDGSPAAGLTPADVNTASGPTSTNTPTPNPRKHPTPSANRTVSRTCRTQ
jgi:hypothetical protein